VTDVAIAALAREPIDQVRAWLDPDRVAYYEEHWADAAPVVVYDVHGTLLLVDGYHRLAAAQRLGQESIAADVRSGERGDALRFVTEVARRQRGSTGEQVMDAMLRRQGAPRPPQEMAPRHLEQR
jgi:hypothetical protein